MNPSSANAQAQSQPASSPQPHEGERGEQSLQSAAQRQGATNPGGSSSGNQEVLKAQIQELLKEVSGELKQLQQQLATAKDLPKPQAGTGTDPNLYEAPMPLERATGGPLPIQLQTDTAQTNAQRKGTGIGTPAGIATSASPQVKAEDAQLSEHPEEESAASRQPVPPEYQSVFDQLRHRSPQPSESRQ